MSSSLYLWIWQCDYRISALSFMTATHQFLNERHSFSLHLKSFSVIYFILVLIICQNVLHRDFLMYQLFYVLTFLTWHFFWSTTTTCLFLTTQVQWLPHRDRPCCSSDGDWYYSAILLSAPSGYLASLWGGTYQVNNSHYSFDNNDNNIHLCRHYANVFYCYQRFGFVYLLIVHVSVGA